MIDDVKAALDRIGSGLRVDAFNGITSGKPDFAAMIVRDDEPGCASILAQQMQDQIAEDVLTVIEFARTTMAGDYVMVPRTPTEAMTRELYKQGCTNAGWACVLAAASPTGGE